MAALPRFRRYTATGGVTYLGFNFQHPRWQDERTRQALALALDKSALAGEGPFWVADTPLAPDAIGARMILEGEINLTGVHIPVLSEIYESVLGELERLGDRLHREGKDARVALVGVLRWRWGHKPWQSSESLVLAARLQRQPTRRWRGRR